MSKKESNFLGRVTSSIENSVNAIKKWWNNLKEGNYGDNPGDSDYIKEGAEDYGKKHK